MHNNISCLRKPEHVSDVEVVIVNCSLDWPVRTLSFSYDGRMLASASEDLVIDIADVDTGEACFLILSQFEYVVCYCCHMLWHYALSSVSPGVSNQLPEIWGFMGELGGAWCVIRV